MEEKIEEVLEMIRPRLALHGGDVEFVSFDDISGKVEVRMKGACSGCPLSQLTLKAGIEALLISELPKVKIVEAID